jgi:hypothetical protein
MGIDIGGNTIIQSAGGISLNTLAFNSAGQGSANAIPGYSAAKGAGGNFYSAPTGWELDSPSWQSSLNTSNGVFTCPVAGLYAMGYNGIHNGGSGMPAGKNTYGYSCFAKNGVMSYHVHWNQGGTPFTIWNTSGTCAVFSCAAGDTLALFVNRSPSPTSPDSQSQNYGLYPASHHCVWCKLIG